MADRYRDPGLWVQLLWSSPILVRCPSCRGAACVASHPDDEHPLPHRGTRPRLTCPSCAYVREAKPVSEYRIGGRTDPFFGAALLLQDDCAGHTLWAYNEPHLDVMARYISAKRRERADFTDSQHQSMLEKLPAWMKDARNRDAVSRSLERLRALVPSPTTS